MAIEGIYASASALRLADNRIRQSAHNVANATTSAYRPGRVEAQEALGGGVQSQAVTTGPAGPVVASQSPLDLAIDGGGFFVLGDGAGGQVYTRAGNFSLDAEGVLVDQAGRQVLPGMQVPENAAQIHVGRQGQLQALAADGTILAQGQLQTATFANPAGMKALGGNTFQATGASGPPVVAAPGEVGHGQIISSAREMSGVNLADEMVSQIITQRFAEANVKAVRTQDELTGTIMDVVG